MSDFMPWDDRTRRRLKLRDLDILLAVVETGSMGKAAKRLNTSQPAVSKAVVELEHALGVRLVDRSRRGVVPTPYGLALAKHSVAIFNDLRQGVQDSIFFPIRPRAKSASERPNRSRRQLFCLRLTGYRANTRRCASTSSPAIRRRSTEMSVNETSNLRFAG
jgi:DNA-binding transcriptional LysR family regulator